ncbi:CaiB/BaiF CoA transferase family protein [Aeromicrobium chenweiae]|uniref:Carnitine dehydratase n=1 Tax=Aeromicrobium chenweiae TaxID=2079793 RepID=A0A2S0WRF4_9ACTN|nr:CaiB/BaiF CoA-transferase family protein [Aeromicrobium chenweiae]AWB93897.1 carnitine dehydratase [Aeromicrobium chenweiae]TGN30942.1 CoA transferase [Aeromicrobium chenweiae]
MTNSPPSGPLHGVRVVELVGIGPGPFAAMLLADLGADVIRVDRPGGNALQLGAADKDILGRGRPSVAIDLKNPRGVETVLDLVESADILIEGLRPGVTERLGLGPQECHARNPRLVYGRMTGWGQDGPLAQTAGHDINYISVAGALGAIGRAGGPPQVPLNLVGDFAGGSMYLVTGVLAALTHARATGEGQVIDAAITDGTAHLMSMIVAMQQSGSWSNHRGTNMLDTGTPFYDVFETSDGQWMSVGPLEPQFYAALIEGLGLTDAPGQYDFARWGELRQMLTETFASRTRAEWEQLFDGTDACVAPVLSIEEAYTHPHNVARGTYVERDGLTQPAPAPRFSATPATLTTPPERAGASTTAALNAWGIADVDQLIADGVAVQAD